MRYNKWRKSVMEKRSSFAEINVANKAKRLASHVARVRTKTENYSRLYLSDY